MATSLNWSKEGELNADLEVRRHVASALAKLDSWIEAEGFQGWDPYDALNSPLLRWAGRRQRLLGIAMVQLLRRSPVNLRPLLGIHKGFNPKGMGLFLGTYAQRFKTTRQKKDLELTRYFFNWLIQNASPGYTGPCWGYNFDWPNRGFFAPAGTPTIVNTAFIGHSFLSVEQTLSTSFRRSENPVSRTVDAGLGEEQWLRESGSTIARGACEFILHDLHILRPSGDEMCFSYTPIDRRFVHNANVLGAWLLAAVYTRTKESFLAKAAAAAARFTTRRQRPDGSWAYGVAMRDRWVDNFHTGYVLVGLNQIAACIGTDEFDPAIRAGYHFWKTRMFQSNLIPKYYADRTYPIDVHSVAQAILTYLEFSNTDPEARKCAWRLAAWASKHMQNTAGFFHYQMRNTYQINIPYMRWSQAWIQRAFTALCVGATRDRGEPIPRPAATHS